MSSPRMPRPVLPSDRAYREYPTHVYPYRAGAAGGFLGGLAMIAVGAASGLLSGRGLWFPVNLIGATFVTRLQNASPAELMRFDPEALAAGLFLHLLMSTALGFLFALLLPALPGRPWAWAVVVGPALVAASLSLLPFINPVMDRYLDRASFVLAHVLYGLVMGLWVAHVEPVPVRPGPDAAGRPVR